MPNKIEYVCGFLFDETMERVVLIKKARPDWQKGKLNGVGGKIEIGESRKEAMIREFREETFIDDNFNWEEFMSIEGEESIVFFYVTFVDEKIFNSYEELFINQSSDLDLEEQADCFHLELVERYPQVPNLKYILSFLTNVYNRTNKSPYLEIKEYR